jgi:putative peptidoglycan lipid II flippase
LKRYILMALPLMIGQSITVVDEQFVRIFGSLAGVGAISWLSYARRIMMVPVSVVAQAAGTASYPFLADLFSKNDLPGFYRTISSALQNVLTLLIPLSAWMILFAEPVIRLIFQQGRFDASDTAQTARLLGVLLVCVPCWGYQQVLGRAFYSKLDTLSPAVLGTSVTVLSIPLFYLLTRDLGAMGTALASSVSLFAYCAALTLWWKMRAGGAIFVGLPSGAGKVVALTAVCLLPAWVLGKAQPFDPNLSPCLAAFSTIIFGGLSFGVIFAVLSGRFIPELAGPFLGRIGPMGERLLRRGNGLKRAS